MNLVENCPNHPISISVSGLGTSLWRDRFFFFLFFFFSSFYLFIYLFFLISSLYFWDGLRLSLLTKFYFIVISGFGLEMCSENGKKAAKLSKKKKKGLF